MLSSAATFGQKETLADYCIALRSYFTYHLNYIL
jgi:hypothetical protein